MKKLTFVLAFFAVIFYGYSQDRHFAWAYESTTLPKGSIDVESFYTVSTGRENFYNRFAHRLELEVGLSDRLQTAFYFNSKHEAAASVDSNNNINGLIKKSGFSMSNEWKVNILNPSVSPVGLGLYGEFTIAPHEVEFEYKILIDKKTEKDIIAFNHVGEYEIKFEYENVDGKGKIVIKNELVFVHNLAYMRMIKPTLGIGLELQTHTEIVKSKIEHTTLFAGPSFFYNKRFENGKSFFISLTPLMQVTSFGSEHSHGSNLELVEHEKLESRILVGFSF